MAAIIEFCALRLFRRTYLRGTASLVVVVIPILSSVCLASLSIVSKAWIAMDTVLLVIRDPVGFQQNVEMSESFSITGVEPISPELPHLALSHELDLLHLSSSKLYLSWVDSARASTQVCVVWLFSWVQVTVVVIIVQRWWVLFGISCLSVLLSNSGFELVDGTFFKFLTHYLLFTEP